MPVLTLYSRPECHLCEAVHTELLALVRDRAELRVVDVDGSPALERRYGLRIPSSSRATRSCRAIRSIVGASPLISIRCSPAARGGYPL